MNNLITVQIAKKHSKVLHNVEDDLVDLYLDSGLMSVKNYIDRPLDGSDPVPFKKKLVDGVVVVEMPLELEAPLVHASLLYAEDGYRNRSSQTEVELKLNPTLERLMNPYRKMGV